MNRYALTAALLFGTTACATRPAIRSARVVAELTHLPKAEGEKMRNKLVKLGARGETKEVILPSRIEKHTGIGDVCQQATEWHEQVVLAQAEATGTPPESLGIEIRFTYDKVRVDTESSAFILIRPQPRGATLYIESDIPGIDTVRDENNKVELNYPSESPNSFRFAVPFSFIRDHNEVYFSTELDGIRSEFVFDLQTQEQRPRGSFAGFSF